MSLLNELDSAEYILVDDTIDLVWVWYGGNFVNVLDERGDLIRVFDIELSTSRRAPVDEIRAAIAACRQEWIEEDVS